MGFILYIVSIILYIILTPISLVVVMWKYSKTRGFWKSLSGYFFQQAIDIDKFGNHNYRTLFNSTLIKSNGYQFGREDETISSVLGKNLLKGTLTRCGRVIVGILDFLDKNHCIKAIKEF